MSNKRMPVNTWAGDNKDRSYPETTGFWADPQKRNKALKLCGIAVGAVVVVGAVVGLGSKIGDSNAPSVPGVTIVSQTSVQAREADSSDTPHNSILQCQESNVDGRVESSSEGDTSSPAGFIVAYEHVFFVKRDARAMVDMTIPSKDVAGEEPLARSISQMAPDTPWCVTVTPAGGRDEFTTQVRFVEPDGVTVTTWNQLMALTKNDEGQWGIRAVRAI
ncbi:hypothetical protein EEB14_33380 [Rhodococcus sp. WS4]|nr:hypothetical protein EEB14_33380 [Rhodococcus sp. WS4]